MAGVDNSINGFVNKWLVCIECGQQFLWDAGEQQWYFSRQLVHAPRRCKSCRDRKRNQRADRGYQVFVQT